MKVSRPIFIVFLFKLNKKPDRRNNCGTFWKVEKTSSLFLHSGRFTKKLLSFSRFFRLSKNPIHLKERQSLDGYTLLTDGNYGT